LASLKNATIHSSYSSSTPANTLVDVSGAGWLTMYNPFNAVIEITIDGGTPFYCAASADRPTSILARFNTSLLVKCGSTGGWVAYILD